MAKGSSFRVNFRVFRVEAVGFEGVGLKWKSKNPTPSNPKFLNLEAQTAKLSV